jgi:hypothetical protein
MKWKHMQSTTVKEFCMVFLLCFVVLVFVSVIVLVFVLAFALVFVSVIVFSICVRAITHKYGWRINIYFQNFVF